LAAPVDIVEERTVGPSLGQDNIDKGMLSVIVGSTIPAIPGKVKVACNIDKTATITTKLNVKARLAIRPKVL
jgi:hypothetical protein